MLRKANSLSTPAVANAARNSIPEIKARALAEVTGPVDYVGGRNDQTSPRMLTGSLAIIAE